ncbi:MAG: type IV toxin-antitoxin system AbiEi family antitoxin domain-containing protein [Sediminispirochaetaceae bacterium]
MQEKLVDLPDSRWLKDRFREYRNPEAKIRRLVDAGELIRLKQGYYITSEAAVNPYMLGRAANRLYGPSYVSFAYAMRWYGLIPEHVPHITSATYGKRRRKRFDTPAGSFFYQDVPRDVFHAAVMYIGEGNERFLGASPEKALCDELYRFSGIRSSEQIQHALFEDLRIDESDFFQLDLKLILEFAGEYRTETIRSLIRFIRKSIR